MNINPVFHKEMTSNTRSMRIPWIIFGCNLVLGLIAVLCFFGESSLTGYLTPVSYSMPMRSYVLMAYALFALVLVSTPAIAGGSIALEREKKTLDMLLVTNLSPWKIIVGKLEASLGLLFVLACSAMPVLSMVTAFGGIDLLDLFLMIGCLLVSGIFIGSVGIFCSVIFRKSTVAIVMAYAIVLAFVVGTAAAVALCYYLLDLRAMSLELAEPVSVGPVIYLLLLNPFLSFAGLICRQIGSGYEIMEICNLFGSYSSNPVVTHMQEIGVCVQLLLSAALLAAAGYRINPLNR